MPGGKTAHLHYFAYGSNLYSPRLRARVPSARAVCPAVLAGHRLTFMKDGADSSGKCNVAPGTADDAVHGVLYRIHPAEKGLLDAVEGPEYYTWWRLFPAAGTRLAAFLYVACPGTTATDIRPFDWYRAFVVAGAREHSLPPDYIEALHAVPDQPDPDAARARANRALLERAP